MKRNKFKLTTARAVDIFEEIVTCRREYFADNQFFKMTDVWEQLCQESSLWSIKTYRSSETDDLSPKAGVMVFGDRTTLVTDERLLVLAQAGCMFSNFTLAHELGHVALDHHARGAVVKNFQLYIGPDRIANEPPTLEEYETNFAAVFFQCGVALADRRWSALDLARRAFSDVYYVGKAQRIVQLDVFQRHLNRPKPVYERIIL
jgi:hypothetical protein